MHVAIIITIIAMAKTMYNCTYNMMIIRAGMELGQVLSEEQRKERFSSSMRRKRAAAQEVEKITLMKKS